MKCVCRYLLVFVRSRVYLLNKLPRLTARDGTHAVRMRMLSLEFLSTYAESLLQLGQVMKCRVRQQGCCAVIAKASLVRRASWHQGLNSSLTYDGFWNSLLPMNRPIHASRSEMILTPGSHVLKDFLVSVLVQTCVSRCLLSDFSFLQIHPLHQRLQPRSCWCRSRRTRRLMRPPRWLACCYGEDEYVTFQAL